MNNFIRLFLVLSLSLLLASCSSSKRPKMAYDQKDKGAVQEIESFNVKASAENFRKTAEQFNQDSNEILNKNKKEEKLVRRISLTEGKAQEKKSLKLIDRNLKIKNLEDTEVSLKLNNMNIRSALKLFAGLVQRNIIIGNEVNGEITIDFENIKWGSAVYAILDINSLIMTVDEDSGLLRVHTKEFFAELEKSKIDNTIEQNNNLASLEIGGSVSNDGDSGEPMITEIFKVFYQSSTDLVESLGEIMGEAEGFTMVDDEKNNQIVITGTYAQLNQAENILNKIDLEKKQVMIEAYIVNATDGFNKNFSANIDALNASATKNGSDRITFAGIDTNPSNTTSVEPVTDSSPEAISNTDLSDAVNLAGGAFLLGNIGMTKIKAVITASVKDSNTETVSNPKLFAMDGESATLTQGTTLLKVIPASGDVAGSTVEIPQNLSITVTPEIVGESRVKIELTLANDAPGEDAGDDVVTNEESLTSVVQINAGDVAVLGGVYKNTRENSETYVPFFSKIPLLGALFRQTTDKDDKTQLLIFLSANVV
ncbi:secretin N-terminal domain-containing protein [Candidatus Pelagibacter sp. HIMB1321]|uniref:secretin N-terminal domain-containing protein n=1 Tax=Candidatus Pelagibacter sp. HIMB1321 TaxID=1388755 RepID=UPI000A0801C4|nr:secretin N-terminal domain-containing protein [Candidatus Pelagibacter sp. HIMB1321]SMF77592.1 type IV pilus assembly protein PilQ [Candidatus Pelagibacter sp. HIMB1321]